MVVLVHRCDILPLCVVGEEMRSACVRACVRACVPACMHARSTKTSQAGHRLTGVLHMCTSRTVFLSGGLENDK